MYTEGRTKDINYIHDKTGERNKEKIYELRESVLWFILQRLGSRFFVDRRGRPQFHLTLRLRSVTRFTRDTH